MGLAKYNEKRDFKATPEPKGAVARSKIHKGKSLAFVVQKHDASHLHYDFRLEMEGVLKSWAVPKGPSLDPSVKRLAMQVEDHPWSYRDFEGEIPSGNYGAGDVIVWDNGTYEGEGGEQGLLAGLAKGHLRFTMHGKKLNGEFSLVRTGREKQWLLMKKDDVYATTEDVSLQTNSVLSDRLLKRDSNGTGKTSGKVKAKGAKITFTEKDLQPMLATLTDAPFDDPDWIFEVKWDGYRTLAKIDSGEVQLLSRNGIDATKKYPVLAEALSNLPHSAVIDGELVALGKDGRPNFSLMQNAGANAAALVYYAFDLLFLDGEDLRKLPLIERKEKLQSILPKKGIVRYSDHIEKTGIKYFAAAEKQELEGVMAKRKDSPYLSGKRSENWLKVKTIKRQEVVIVGYTEPKGSRKNFGSLVLAVRDDADWRYVGHVGTGFDSKAIKALYDQMQPLIRKAKPVLEKVPVEAKITWLKPEMVCEVKFTEWTPERQMRHPVFVGLRNDKKSVEVSEEKEVPVAKVTKHAQTRTGTAKKTTASTTPNTSLSFTHTDKVYWPEDGYTKGDAIEYYDKISETILPYLKDRPMVLNRHPNGIDKPSFYQKNVETENLPKFIQTTTVHSESTDEDINYIVCNNKETLLYIANLGAIELNPWSGRLKDLDKPDWLVIDLDPGTNTFEEVITVAKVVHEVLEMSCEKSYVKTSGKTGLHIFVPLKGKYHFDKVRSFAELLVRIVHERLPDLTSIERSPAKRKDKIYLDFLQNRVGQTLAAPYSIRPVAKACVSTPLEWKEVRKGLSPEQFTIKTIFSRLKKKGDLWDGILEDSVDLAASLKCLQKSLEEKTIKEQKKN